MARNLSITCSPCEAISIQIRVGGACSTVVVACSTVGVAHLIVISVPSGVGYSSLLWPTVGYHRLR